MIKYELIINESNQVGYYLLSNGMFFHDLMDVRIARNIIEHGTLSLSDKKPGFPLCVDEKYFIEATIREE